MLSKLTLYLSEQHTVLLQKTIGVVHTTSEKTIPRINNKQKQSIEQRCLQYNLSVHI